MTLFRTVEFDVAIYVSRDGNEYRLRYEFLVDDIAADILASVDNKMQKSFSLGGATPDATTERSIDTKAKLMERIFETSFGFNATIIYEFTSG